MRKFLPLLIIIILAGCSSNTVYTTGDKSKRKTHKKYNSGNAEVTGKVEFKAQETTMVCSYYGKAFHGKPTANGEIFDMFKYTCAHKTLPFDTKIKLTNPDNEKSVVVRVNDRGPFVPGRDLDLSYGAAKKIGLVADGVKELKAEILK